MHDKLNPYDTVELDDSKVHDETKSVDMVEREESQTNNTKPWDFSQK